MTSADPWQTAEIAGPKKAAVITKPAMARAVIRRAQHPVLLIGHSAALIDLGGRKLVDYLLDLARAQYWRIKRTQAEKAAGSANWRRPLLMPIHASCRASQAAFSSPVSRQALAQRRHVGVIGQ